MMEKLHPALKAVILQKLTTETYLLLLPLPVKMAVLPQVNTP